jgi:hypothetical protein
MTRCVTCVETPSAGFWVHDAVHATGQGTGTCTNTGRYAVGKWSNGSCAVDKVDPAKKKMHGDDWIDDSHKVAIGCLRHQ